MSSRFAPAANGKDPDGSRQSELARVLDDYLAAVEGSETVDPDALATAHPEIADRLRACLAALRVTSQVEARADADAAIKPANLPVDVRGNLWITDFGLARMQTDNGLTMTGNVIGTLRYMSPEQSSARRGIVDHSADVYSLGASLYELLTLHPADDGRDRGELLHQPAFDEPRRPRFHNPAVPRDLEAIVLKAVARDIQNRYATPPGAGRRPPPICRTQADAGPATNGLGRSVEVATTSSFDCYLDRRNADPGRGRPGGKYGADQPGTEVDREGSGRSPQAEPGRAGSRDQGQGPASAH